MSKKCPKDLYFCIKVESFNVTELVLLLEEVILCQIPVCVHCNSTFLVLIESVLLFLHMLLKNTSLQHKFTKFIVINHAFHVTGYIHSFLTLF